MERLTKRYIPNDEKSGISGIEVFESENKISLVKVLSGEYLYPAIEKLADYEDLEEQGLLVRLPCKLKNKLYHFYGIDLEDNFADVTSGEIIMEVVATEFIIDSYEIAIKCITDWNSPYEYLPVTEFGKTVFLTREEAEKKLEEMKK